jgi:hypothetical protein
MATKTLGPEGALAALEQVREWANADFGPPGPDHSLRLGQLDSMLNGAAMAVQHLVDEDARERHLRSRLEAEPAVADKHGHQARPWLEA